MKKIDSFCLSSYLAFRYVAKQECEWLAGVEPEFPCLPGGEQIPVGTPDEILSTLKEMIAAIPDIDHTAIFLSGGIDSAILAALLPEGSMAFTINFVSATGANEAERATVHAGTCGLSHCVVDVTWDDYEKYEEELMINKKAPLHAVEVALYKAAITAKEQGVKSILLGNGADSTFGGLDKLLSIDWPFEDFVERYTFIMPDKVLADPCDIHEIYEPYRTGEGIDYVGFLKNVHGMGVIQAFNNAIHSVGLDIVEPFEGLKLKGKLDLDRIRSGEPKYLLVEVFNKLFPGLEPPTKVAFARPMDEWLSNYQKPVSPVFKADLDLSQFSGDQKYLIHSLDKFISLLEDEKL
jgi:hypothetical protein